MSIIEQAAKRLEEMHRASGGAAWSAIPAASNEPASHAAVGGRAGATLRPADAPRLANAAGYAAAPEATPPRVDVVLDIAGLERAGQIVPTAEWSVLAEELRSIKRPLLKSARSKNAVAERLPLIMVTSALPGEGKTFFAINLAMSIATEIDLSVLLIDGDVVRQDAMDRLGVGRGSGLLDLLTDPSIGLDDVVLRTNVPKLSVLRAGNRHNLSTELLASSAMDELLHRLVSEFPRQIVIFDAPPLLVTSQAKVLASRIGQVVLVIEASQTQRGVVTQAFAAVEQCPIVLSVLNKVAASSSHHDGGYGYGYGYGA